MMWGKGFHLGTIAGIRIRIDYSWIFILAFFVFMFASMHLPASVAGAPMEWYLGVAILLSLLLFASVVVHELSHALVARRAGVPVHTITLFLLGGVAELEEEPRSPGAEFSVAIVGPLTSLVLGGVFWALARGLPAPPLITVGLRYLGGINLALALFNLLPGYPMDGGRVLRAVLWRARGDLLWATRWASWIGQGFGWAFMLLGFVSLFTPVGVNISGLWLILIGWFLTSAARSSYQQQVLQSTLEQVPVGEVVSPNVTAVLPSLTIQQLVTLYYLHESPETLPVAGEDGTFVGMINLRTIQAIPRDRWAQVTVAEMMTPASQAAVLHPDNDAWDAVKQLTSTHDDQVLVTEQNHVTGAVTRATIARWLQVHTRIALGPASG